MQVASHGSRREDGRVVCGLCPQGCVLAEGEDGVCHVRGVRDGELIALAYGAISSAGVDPIEKKPLYHFWPGTGIFSVGGWGCNLRCAFCQNWEISQQFRERGRHLTPDEVIHRAVEAKVPSIAYTYNEPIVGFEFVRDCARLAHESGLANVLVTNGYINPGPGRELLEDMDALNIDLKSFDDAFYRDHCGARLAPVLNFLEAAHAAGCHVEVTNLVIPDHNDAPGGVRALATWLSSHLSATVPLHLSAYFPRYKFEAEATSGDGLRRARDAALEALTYVYLGNVAADREGRDTTCPACGTIQVIREGYRTRVTGIRNGRCQGCGRPADIVEA